MNLRRAIFPLLVVSFTVPLAGLTRTAQAENDVPVESGGSFPVGNDGTVDVIVQYVDGASAVEEVAQLDPVEVKDVFDAGVNGAAITVTPADLAILQNDPDVAVVEPDHQMFTMVSSWGLDRIDQASLPLSGTFNPSGTGSGVVVYVIDTGIRATHADFGGRVLSGYSTYPGLSATSDCHGHGTHVAGTIGGATYGVARGVTIVPVRAFNSLCQAWSSDVIMGLAWIRAYHSSLNPPRPGIVNISMGGQESDLVNSAVETTVAAGISVVVAAGNGNIDACEFSPAGAPSAITVSASTIDDARWAAGPDDGSNWGTCVDVYAPGVAITSAWAASNSSSTVMTGTSMASPHVAGALALLAQGSISTRPFESQLLSTASLNKVSGNISGTPNALLYLPPSSPMTIVSSSLKIGLRGKPYSENLSAEGSTPPYTWRVSSGRIPRGMTLSSNGVISGSPSRDGSSTFSVTVTSGTGASTARQLTLQIAPRLEIRSRKFARAQSNVAYTTSLVSRGGIGNVTWTVSGLPAGLEFDGSTGTISGAPTTPGSYPVTVTVTDSDGNSVSRALTLQVR